MKLQLVSDIHLELVRTSKLLDFTSILKPVADILALAGDIGNPTTEKYHEFLEYCSKNFKTVLYIPGNHEYYNNYTQPKQTMDERIQSIKSVCKLFSNIHLLDRNEYWLSENHIVLGATLWSMPSSSITYSRLNDCNMIYAGKDKRLTFTDYIDLHELDSEWLENKIHQHSDKQVIIITHHVPTFDLISPKFKKYGELNTCFASDCTYLFQPNIVAWLCGHTHTCERIYTNNIQFVINAHGYSGENVEGFTNECIIELQ